MEQRGTDGIHAQAQKYADLTKELIISGNIRRVKRCFQLAEKLLSVGTAEMKNAVTNVYLFSISSFMETHHCNIKGMLTEKLHQEYKKQVNASGI